MANVNTGKIIVCMDGRDATKIPEFFKVRGLLVQSWFYGCIHIRPCWNCNKTGHDRWKCPKQGTTTNNKKQQQTTQNSDHNLVQNNETTPKSYAESVKTHSIPPENVAQEPVQGRPNDFGSTEIEETKEENKKEDPTIEGNQDQTNEEMETDIIEKLIAETTPANDNKNKKKQNKGMDKPSQAKNPETVYPNEKEEIIELLNATIKSNSTTQKACTQEEEHNLGSEPIKLDENIQIQEENPERKKTAKTNKHQMDH
ncbi:hypothetical protein ACJMK2_013543 [Sinanodonta woodiana]